MTFGRYIEGVALIALALVPVALGAVALRRRLLPGWSGPPALLADVLLAIGQLLVVSELLGAVALYERLAVSLGCAALGGALAVLVRRGPEPAAESPTDAPPAGWGAVVAVLACALVVGQWGVGTVGALHHGPTGPDTLGYHGPVAARFVQDGKLFQLLYLSYDSTVTFLPFNSELLHSLGMLWLGSDVLLPLLNLGFLGLALLSAWCIGRRFGVGAAALLGTALVLAAPSIAISQGGSADNDIAAVSFLLAAAAVLLTGGLRLGPLAVAGLAAGISIGTKPTTSAAIVTLTLGVLFLLGREARGRGASIGSALPAIGAWLGPLALGGGAWYLRNLVNVGNPLPWFSFDLGPLALHSSETRLSNSVAHYATDFHVWRRVFVPGLHSALGTVWPVIIVLGVVGIVVSVADGRSSIQRMLGVVALAAAVAYFFTPGAASGPEGFPVFFSSYVRYTAPALTLGLALLPVWPRATEAARSPWAAAVLGLLLLLTLRSAGFATVTPSRTLIFLGVAALLVPAALGYWSRVQARPPAIAAAGAVAAIALVAVGYAVERRYLDNRYANGRYAFASRFRHAHIAISGDFLQYHLYGPDLSNRVQYLGRHKPHGGYAPIRSCARWQRALATNRYGYVVLTPVRLPDGKSFAGVPEVGWTRALPRSRAIVAQPDGTRAFSIARPVTPAGCGGRRAG